MGKRKDHMELMDILERLRSRESIRKIKQNTGTHRTIIREIRDLAEKNGWLDPSAPLPDEHELYQSRGGENEGRNHPLDSFERELKTWKEKGYTYIVIHQLIKDRHNCSEATVRRYLQKKFPDVIEPVMVRNAVIGMTMEVDFGYVGLLYDSQDKRNRKAYLFSARLNYSKVAWREIVFDQRQETFFQCHINAFEYFGGVPKEVVPDNLKAAVIKASYEDPLVNRSYKSLARHYGFKINPCLPRTPEHKGGVENDIRYVKRNFMPIFREKEIQRGREMPSLSDANHSLATWSKETAHERQIKDMGCRPSELFAVEKTELLPLSNSRWDNEAWTEATVGRDWRIKFDKSKYSVPYEKVGCSVMVCATMTQVCIFHEHKLVTRHARATQYYQAIIKDEHAPPYKLEYMNETRDGIYQKAQLIGPETAKTIKAILDRKYVDGLRPARKLLGFEKDYSAKRLENACARANLFETPTYSSVKNILINELDHRKPEAQLTETVVKEERNYRFARTSFSITGLYLIFIFSGEVQWMILFY